MGKKAYVGFVRKKLIRRPQKQFMTGIKQRLRKRGQKEKEKEKKRKRKKRRR